MPILRACSITRPAIGVVLLLLLFAWVGCQKPEDGIGLDVLDPDDALGTETIDTVSIIAWTNSSDPVRTSGLSRNVLGTYLDPDFGTISAGIVAQVLLSSNAVGPANADYVCDSLVLSLAYDGITFGYGNLDPQSFNVFRLNEDLRTDSTYKQNRMPGVDLDNLVAGPGRSFVIDPTTYVQVGTDSLVPQLRIPLDQALGEELLDQWGGSNLDDNNTFLSYFKGLVVLPADEPTTPFQQAALYFNLLGGASKLTLYYHDLSDTMEYVFPINSSSVRYTVSSFRHENAPQPGLPAVLADTALGQQRIYLQGLGGLRSQLRFPHLDRYDEGGIRALAKAELVIPVDGSYPQLYAPPNQIFAFRKNDAGGDAVLPDQSTAANQVGGIYDATNREYRLVITQWVQGVIDGTYPNTGLALVAGASGVTTNRVILAGPENPLERMKLRLTFTTY